MSAVTEGTTLYVYGHSYLGMDLNSLTTGQRYINRAAGRLAFGRVVNNAVGGYRMQDAALDAVGRRDPSKSFIPGSSGFGFIDCTLNDVNFNGAGAQALRGYENSLRALLYAMSMAGKMENTDPAVAISGGMQQITNGDFSGGSFVMTPKNTVGHITLPVQGPRKLVLGFGGLPCPGAPVDIFLNDTNWVGHFDPSYQCVTSPFVSGNGDPRNWCPVAVPIDIPAGNWTLRISNAALQPVNAEGPFFDYAGTYSLTPMQIGVMKCNYLTDQGYQNANHGAANNGTVDAYNAVLARVVAEFPNAFVVDAQAGWNPDTMTGADRIHVSARGADHLASAVVDAFNRRDFSAGSSW